jgi:cytoskeletal protein RodZ
LTTLIGNTAVPNTISISTTEAQKKRGWLPLLTVLFLVSYGIMTMLIVEQGQTIESQRALIRELFRDSTELSASKLKASQDKNVVDAQHAAVTKAPTQAPSATAPAQQYPSTQIPSAQVPAPQAPSAQAVPQHHAQMQAPKGTRPFQMPSRPASDLADDLRALILI